MNALVLGIGNILLSDEGAGVRALQEFATRYEVPSTVQLVDGGTCGMELLQYIQGQDLLIILDVVKSGNPPGTIMKIEGEEVPALFQKRISPHQLGLSDLLAAAKLTDSMPEKIILFGIEPDYIKTGLAISPKVRKNMGRFTGMVARELLSSGLDVKTRKSGREGPQKCVSQFPQE